MHFDLLTDKAKARAQVLHGRRQLALERGMRKRVLAVLNRTFAEVAAHARHGIFDFEHVVASQRAALQHVIGGHYTTIGQQFLASVEDAYARRQGHGGKKGDGLGKLEVKGMADEFWRVFNNWAFADAFDEVTKINDVTKRLLRRILRREASAGSSYGAIADAIVAATKRKNGAVALNEMRATRIARTDTHRASTFAVNEAVRSTRVRFDREWVSMADDRVRPAPGTKAPHTRWNHRKANGQRRAMNVPFDVSGEKLMFPGDTSLGASAANVVNCRCVLIYHAARSAVHWI